MGVLVRVDVRYAETGVLQASDLGFSFAGDFVWTDPAGECGAGEAEQGGPKAQAIGAEECPYRAGLKNGSAIGENDVATDTKLRVLEGEIDGIGERRASGHEGRGV